VGPSSSLELPPAGFYAKGASLVLPTGLYLHDGTDWVAVEDDTGWRSDGWVAKAGWSNPGAQWRVRNGMSDLRIRARRTGANIAGTSSGRLSDTPVLDIPAAASSPSWMLSGSGHMQLPTDSGVWFYRLFGGGINLTAINPDTNLATDTTLFANLTYLL
jgi:hypothetical protein